MPTKRDYYEILGLSKSATDDQIKQAYRKLAREHHPDMVKDSDKKAAEERFKEINEAYQVLSDAQKRKMYDQFGHNAGPAGFGGGQQPGGASGWGPFSYSYSTNGGAQGQSPFGDIDPFEVFESFFGFGGFGGRQPRKGKNLAYSMQISFAEAVHGLEKTVAIEGQPLTVKIPAGVHDGTEIKFSGRGQAGPAGMPAGDLFITINVKMPQEFQVIGEDFGIAVELDFVTASIGGSIEVLAVEPTSSDGLAKVELKIPAGTQHGTQFRLRGKGMPKMRGNGRADIIVQVFISIPRKLSKRQKELLEQYKIA